MNCPNCGKEMAYGFLQSDAKSSMTWVSKLLPMGIGCWAKDAKVVSEPCQYGQNYIPAHICKDCKLVVGDYSNKLK